MPSRLLFQKQSDPRHLLESLLIALSFTSPLESKYAQKAVSGFVYNKYFYINNQRIRGWLKKQNDLLHLTEKAKRLVQESDIDLVTNKTKGDIKINHEALLVRSLFLCLLHLNFGDIVQIKKQKYYEGRFIPDLTIVTKTDTIFIEVDTGKQPVKTLESKIRGLQAQNREATLIYFTSSDKHYSHFHKNCNVQFIYLDSPTLAEDILQLFSTNRAGTALSAVYPASNALPEPNSNPQPNPNRQSNTTSNRFFYPISKANIKLAHNVFVHDKTLTYDPTVVGKVPNHEPIQLDLAPTLDLEKLQAEVIKLLTEDD